MSVPQNCDQTHVHVYNQTAYPYNYKNLFTDITN